MGLESSDRFDPEFQESLPLPLSRLYLEIPKGEHIPLHLLLYYQSGDVLDQVFFLNRARRGKGGVQFLCYTTGEFYLPGRDSQGDRLVGDLRELLSWVT